MARYEYMALTQAVKGRQAEFEHWYDTVHLADVLKIPGIVGARRLRVVSVQAEGLEASAWCSLAIYEMETDNPEQVVAAVRAVAGTAAMPLSGALERTGMVQIVAEPVGPHSTSPGG